MAGFGSEAATSPDRTLVDGPFEHVHVHVRGLRLHVAVAGDPQHPLVLLLHGAFGGWFDWLDVIGPLAEQGFRVAAMDMRGYGASDKPPTPFEVRHIFGDIKGVIGALGASSALLVGCGTGGAISWMFASHTPEYVGGLVSVSAAHPRDMWRALRRRPWRHATPALRSVSLRLPRRLIQWRMGLVARLELRDNTRSGYHHSAGFRRQLQLRDLQCSIAGSAGSMVRFARLELAASSLPVGSKHVHCPVLFVSEANAAWRSIGQLAARRVDGGTFTQMQVPNTKNMPQLEQPEVFTRFVAAFLRQCDPQPAS